jgi:hypothetical protein
LDIRVVIIDICSMRACSLLKVLFAADYSRFDDLDLKSINNFSEAAVPGRNIFKVWV